MNTQLSANANTSSSTIPRTTPTTPPGGRKPSTRPSARVTTDAIVYRTVSPSSAPTIGAGRHTGSDRNRSNTPLLMSVFIV